MPHFKRRKFLGAALGAGAGLTGLAAAAKLADRFGLIPPVTGSLYAAGETLTYASHRLVMASSSAREFRREEISAKPFPNSLAPKQDAYRESQARGFTDWRVSVEGLVARPRSFSLSELRAFPVSTQITQLICEEGWSFVAEWQGVRLRTVLEQAGILPQARFVVYFSVDPGWRDSIDMADALHAQTQLTYAMNGRDLPVGHGGPLRMRIPRQLGYKSTKFVNRIIVTENLDEYPSYPEYSWYAGV